MTILLNQANPIPLDQFSSRVPNFKVQKSSRVNLNSPDLVVTGQGLSRTGRPTTVRVILNKIESITDAVVTPGNDFILGPPEAVVLVDGDQLEIVTWHCNESSHRLTCGVRSEPPFSSYLTTVTLDIPLVPTPGVSLVTLGDNKAPNKLWGARVNTNKCVGGALVRGVVRTEPGQVLRVRLWDAVRVTNAGGSDIEIDWRNGHPDNQEKLHQQCQCYGAFRGEARVSRGSELTLAAPGSPQYSQTATGALTTDEKRAAFWVPLELRLFQEAGAPPATKVTVSPVKASEPFMNVFFESQAARAIRRKNGTASPANLSHPFVDGMRLAIVFLGGASTAATIKIS